MDKKTGIDLGTSNTRICVRGKGVVYSEATAAAFSSDGELIAYGDRAKRMFGKTPADKDAVRPLRGGVISNFEDCVEMLSAVFSATGLRGVISRPKTAISVPSGITEVERNAFENVCVASSGGKDLYMLIKQPMAAAVGCGTDVMNTRGKLICDIGGGNTQTSVIVFRGIVCSGTARIGGDELDESIVRYIKDVYNVSIGAYTAEKIKLAIGSAHRATENGEYAVCGRNLLTGQVVRLILRSGEVREAMTETLERITDHIRGVLEQIPPQLSADVYENGMTLCGGVALMPGIDRYLTEKLSMEVTVADDPAQCVCRGTQKILESGGELLQVVSAGDEY
ncbi:MAG: rod shape-determining protein [Clostridia bacterium]|nr:rod shape-determining protein [Clostridia bacterium]